MGATLFELLSVTSGSVFLLYAVFVLIYFFLFKFFLGETLGDRLFRERGIDGTFAPDGSDPQAQPFGQGGGGSFSSRILFLALSMS